MNRKISIFLVVLSLFLATAACRLASGEGKIEPTSTPSYQFLPNVAESSGAIPSPTPPPAAEAQPPPLSAAASRVVAAVEATASLYPRTLRGEVTPAGETFSSLVTMWYQAEGLYQVEVVSPNGDIFESIVIAPTVYVNMGGGWQTFGSEAEAGTFGTFHDLDSSFMDMAEMVGTAEPQLAGREIINEVDTEIFTFTQTLADGSTSNTTIWIGAQDNLVYKYTIENTSGTRAEGMYNFTTPVVIEPPSEIEPDSMVSIDTK